MMFLDCPAYLDRQGAVRCGLPAEVRCQFTDGGWSRHWWPPVTRYAP